MDRVATAMKIFFSVGEPSGDLHGANLIRELKRRSPELQCVGFGGPKMVAAGLQRHYDLTQLAVMWLLQALLNLPRFWRLVCQADRYFRHQRPDAVVLIDYPGFNWWIARRAKVHRIPVFYYGVPQMWAWAPWRVRKMRRLVDHVLCKLPFEADWYCARGCRAQYVGHPYFDELASRQLDAQFLAELQQDRRPLVTLLPGSRTQEVRANLDAFLQTAGRLQQEIPQVRFAVAAFNQRQAEMAEHAVQSSGLPVPVYMQRTPELIEAATACLACSGSVSLELLYHEKPAVIHYKISRSAFLIQRFFRNVRYITLVNLLASDRRYCDHGELYDPATDDVPLPEYLTCGDRTQTMCDHLATWLQDPTSHRATVDQLRLLKARWSATGATQRVAAYIDQQLRAKQPVCKVHHPRQQAA
jgi:lipid-A-disaccharide synthase